MPRLRPRPLRRTRPVPNEDSIILYTVGRVPHGIRHELREMVDAFHLDSAIQAQSRSIFKNAQRYLQLDRFHGQGNGYKAKEAIPVDTTLAIYSGALRSVAARSCGDHEMHLGNIGIDNCELTIDGSTTDANPKYPGMLQLVNHACSPFNNCKVDWVESASGLGKHVLRSCKPISN